MTASYNLSLLGSTYNQGGSGAVARTTASTLQESVSVKDFGAVGDGSTDDTAALAAFFLAVQGKSGFIPNGVYLTTATLVINTPNTHIYGDAAPGSGASLAGSVIKYTGTGTALRLGVNPDVNGTFLADILLQNLKIEVATNTNTAIYAWHLLSSCFRRVNIFGNSGTGRYGLRVRGGVSNTYEQIDIQGFNGAGGVPANYLQYGMSIELGYLNDPYTATVFRDCYFHYCLYGSIINSGFVDFYHTVIESNTIGLISNGYATAGVYNCWFEANLSLACYFAIGDMISITDSKLDSYAVVAMISANSVSSIVFKACRITSSNVSPTLFDGGSLSGSKITVDGCLFSTAYRFGGVNYGGAPVKLFVDMPRTTYRFVQTAVAANTSYPAVPTESGIANARFIMPEAGHILGARIWYTGTISAGTWQGNPLKNGANVVSLVLAPQSSSPVVTNTIPMLESVVAGDQLSFYIITSIGFAATGGSFVAEVIVQHGNDGRILP